MANRKFNTVRTEFAHDALSIQDLHDLFYHFMFQVYPKVATPFETNEEVIVSDRGKFMLSSFLSTMIWYLLQQHYDLTESMVSADLDVNGVTYGLFQHSEEMGLCITTTRHEDTTWHITPVKYLSPNVLLELLFKVFSLIEDGDPWREKERLKRIEKGFDFDLK